MITQGQKLLVLWYVKEKKTTHTDILLGKYKIRERRDFPGESEDKQVYEIGLCTTRNRICFLIV